jgi:predicted permease
MRELRYAIRALLKAPVFAATAIVTLALCIGANTAIYTVVDHLLLRPLPYPQPDRLAVVVTHFEREGTTSDEVGQTGSTWLALRELATTVAGIDVASVGGTMGINIVTHDRPEYVIERRVSTGFFRILGVPLGVGREFSADEDAAGGPAAVILSHGLWLRAFGGDPGIVGRSIVVRGEPHRVVGVAPARFTFGPRVDVLTPLRPSRHGEGGGQNYEIIARLLPRATWAHADSQVAAAGAAVMRDLYRDARGQPRLALLPLQRGLTDRFRRPLVVLMGAVGIVLVIGCVNIAGLLLARGSARAAEIATRMALGGGRAAIVRQLLAENVVLAACGGIVGTGLGYAGLQVLAFRLADVFGGQAFGLDARVFAITAAASLGTSLFFGLFPAFQASRVDLRSAMVGSAGTAVAGASNRWPHRALVVAQMALAVTLLVAAGLLARTLDHLTRLDPGFDDAGVLTASLSLQDARYQTGDRVVRLFERTLEDLRAVPGIQNAAVCLTLPYERALNMGWRFAGGGQANEVINLTYVTPTYFEALGVPVTRGRGLTAADKAGASPVVVVNEAFVRRHVPREDPIGRQMAIGGEVRTVVGVVGDIQQKSSFGRYGPVAPNPASYVPVAQVSSESFKLWHTWFSPSWIVRTVRGTADAAAEMQRALHAFDPQLPFAKFRAVSDVRAEALAEQRAEAILFGSLSMLAIVLAAVGLYGLMASSVSERTRELGIRLALGASTQQAVVAAAAPGIGLGVAGIAIGLVAARLGSTVMRHLVWGVSAADPLTYAGAAAVVLAAAAVATLVPALRIVRLNPLRALRNS